MLGMADLRMTRRGENLLAVLLFALAILALFVADSYAISQRCTWLVENDKPLYQIEASCPESYLP